MKKIIEIATTAILVIFLTSCGKTRQDQIITETEKSRGNFEPRFDYKPLPGVDVQVFPPRLRGKEGVSLSHITLSTDSFAWTTGLGLLQMSCRVKKSEGMLEIAMTVANNGKSDETVAIRYPEVHYFFENDTTLRVLDPTFGGVLQQRKPYPMVDVYYPGFASFCATLVTGKDKAIGIALRNKQQRSAHILHLPARPAGQMSIELDRVLVPAGESVTLPSAYIATGDDWSDVLKPYRDWFLATFPPKMNPPSWLTNGEYVNVWQAHCMVPRHPPSAAPGIWVFDPAFRERTIEEVHKEVDQSVEFAAKRGSKPLFYQFGWWKMMSTFQGLHMFDGVCGDYTEAHELEKDAIRYIHSKGGKTFLYTNFISAGEESRVFREQPGLFARDEQGAAIRNATYPMFLFCPGSPGIREYWDKVLHYVLIELDADGIFLDQLGGATPSPICTDPAHHHAHPDTYGEDFLGLTDYVYSKAKSLKPDAFVGCELINDVRSMWPDWIQSFGYNRPAEMKFSLPEQAAGTPPNEYMVFLKYINPYSLMVPGKPDEVAFGAPGLPDDKIYQSYKSIFKSGLQPCHTDPVGAMAYLYGPVNGEAILVTKAWADLKDIKVTLPEALKPADGGTDFARQGDMGIVIVKAGKNARFYRLVKE